MPQTALVFSVQGEIERKLKGKQSRRPPLPEARAVDAGVGSPKVSNPLTTEDS